MALSFSVLKLRDFRLMLFTRIFGMMALQAQAVIVGWQIYSITKDPFMLGLTGLAEALPAISSALFAGHIVDNNRPHKIFLIALGILTLNTLMLLIFAGGFVSLDSKHIIILIFSGIFISGLARSYIMPASFSLLPQIVSRNKIPSASAWMSSGFQLAAISGPAIAGIIYGGYGAKAAWMIPTALMFLAFIMLALISSKPRKYRSREVREAASKSILEGWKFILGNRVLLSVMALDMFAVLFGGAVAILPAYADQILQTGSEGLGALRAAPALGSIITALFLALNPFRKLKATLLLAAITGFGFCMIGFGLSKVFWLSMLLLAFSGAFDSISMVMRSTLMQLLTPDNMRGRVSSVNSMFVISSNEIGAFESGLAAKFMGIAPSIIFGGVCTLIVVMVTYIISPKLRNTVVRADELA